jgi:hypothetical protein
MRKSIIVLKSDFLRQISQGPLIILINSDTQD